MAISEAQRRFRADSIRLVIGLVNGDGSLAGRMASSTEGAFDPGEGFKDLVEEYQKAGITDPGEIMDDMMKRFEAIDRLDAASSQ